ncbi:EF-hand domain-containing protein [Chloropicon primus]|uniref:EF-hand domain-containing protein n=1 Tax=Chloropicon primus TaxID=1764295 RepID=A0A5B8MNJ9_9CHLO|nr:hypothetical protein A3770_04p34280 [Chloropicon primus]UPR00120.1 EF-hand domain-containing protein [Chloropicon primus]|mmetsp:Transcript_4028/g.11696  ORF Transcript_4028/g.11696 Transcript_4028/m.11696 type:complete len:310 (+) Transcript_4028:345-1274(+)|eukprot:QDZ20910.1 hypothetical protein A3770_04p34280 [Chloropicon primus]
MAALTGGVLLARKSSPSLLLLPLRRAGTTTTATTTAPPEEPRHRDHNDHGDDGGSYRRPAATPFRRSPSLKEVTGVLVERLRRNPVGTATQLAECLTPMERGAVVSALRRQNSAEGLDGLEKAFLEADADMDGKLSRAEFERYWAVARREQARRTSAAEASPVAPTSGQLAKVALASGIPFVGFGFVDNAIMLTAGSEIEKTLGVALGITTLAAAGLGNLISDVLGLGLADTIESQASKLGVKEPRLAKAQLRLPAIRMTRAMGATVGVTVGCLLGMLPLLFLPGKKSEEDRGKRRRRKQGKEGGGEEG